MVVVPRSSRRDVLLLLDLGLLLQMSLDLVCLTALRGLNPCLVQGFSRKEMASSRMTLLKVPL